MTEVEPLIEETVEIDAPPVQVWPIVADLTRIAEWSPQVVKTLVRGGPVGLGTRMVNLNRRGPLAWPTRTAVVRFEPHREIAWRVKDNRAIWSFALEPTDDGRTRLTHRREMLDGTTALSGTLVDRLMGGQAAFAEEMKQGMRQTLAGVRREAEGVPAAG